MTTSASHVLAKLTVAGLRHRMLLATSWELRDAASAALEAGIYSPSLADAAVFVGPGMDEIGPAFEMAVKELQLAVPEEDDECCWALLRHYVGEIASGAVPPREGIRTILSEVYYGCCLDTQDRAELGDAYGMQQLIGAYHEYDDLLDIARQHLCPATDREVAIAALDAAAVRECRIWLERNLP